MMLRAATPARARRATERNRGTSLIETLLASVMLVMVVFPVIGMFETSSRIFARGDAASSLHQDLRTLVDQMVRELRMAGYDPSATGSPAAFDVAGPTTLRFIADADLDGATDRIEYAYDAAARTVRRRTWRWAGVGWGPASTPLVVARNVDSVALAYFDATDGAPAALGDIRRVTVAVAGSEMVVGHGLERFSVASEARPRNLL